MSALPEAKTVLNPFFPNKKGALTANPGGVVPLYPVRYLPVMNRLRIWCLCLLSLFFALPGRAGLKNGDCLDCHSDKTLAITNAAGKAVSLFVDEAKLKASAHKTNTCISCHTDVTDKHPDDNIRLQFVHCATCH